MLYIIIIFKRKLKNAPVLYRFFFLERYAKMVNDTIEIRRKIIKIVLIGVKNFIVIIPITKMREEIMEIFILKASNIYFLFI